MENKTDIKTENNGITIEELSKAKKVLKNYFDITEDGLLMLKIIANIKYIEKKEKYLNEVLGQLLERYGERDDKGNLVKTEDGKGYKLKENLIGEYVKATVELERTLTDDFKPTLTHEEILRLKPNMYDLYDIFPILKEE